MERKNKYRLVLFILLGAFLVSFININRLFIQNIQNPSSVQFGEAFFWIFISLLIGMLIGFLVSLLIFKIRNPVIFGLIIGFIIPLVFFGTGYYLLILDPLLLLFVKFPSQGGWETLVLVMYVAPLIYTLFGGLIGLAYLLIKRFLQRNKNNKYWLILIILFLLVFYFLKTPHIEITHNIPPQMVNPVTTTQYVSIRHNILLNLFVFLEKITIEQNERVIYSRDISNEDGHYYGFIRTFAVPIEVDPNKIFNNQFEVGKEQTFSLNVYYSRFGKTYKESQDFTVEVLDKPAF